MTYPSDSDSRRDALLVGHMDGEPSQDPDALDTLLASPAGRRRLWELEAADRHLSDALEAVPGPALPPFPAPRARWMRPGRAAAAGLLLAATAAAALPPVRDAIRSGVERIVGTSTPSPLTEPLDPGRVVVGVPGVGRELPLTIDHRQRGGTLAFERTDEADVRVQAGDAEVVVLPGAVRIRNGPSAVGDVRISLPARVERVRLVLDGVERTLVLDEGAAMPSLALAGGGSHEEEGG